jgi:hypothetical protein
LRGLGGADQRGHRIARVAAGEERLAELLESRSVTGVPAQDRPQALDGALVLSIAEIDAGLGEELLRVSLRFRRLLLGGGLDLERGERRE